MPLVHFHVRVDKKARGCQGIIGREDDLEVSMTGWRQRVCETDWIKFHVFTSHWQVSASSWPPFL